MRILFLSDIHGVPSTRAAALPIDDIIREFGLVLWDDYYARSVRLRGGTVK